MKWFEGTLFEAVSTSKQKKAIFVVYVEGGDEASVSMSQVLDKKEISGKLNSSQFVCVKLEKDSAGHKQFTEIYKLVPVPSLFFIGHGGEPLEIVVGNTQNSSEEKINVGIENCLKYLNGAQSVRDVVNPVSSNSSRSGSSAGDVEAGASKMDSQKEKTPPVDTGSVTPESGLSVEEKIERAKLLVARKNEQKRQEEIQKEKDAEKERRRIGQELQKANQMKHDLEMKQLKEEREREKREEAEAKKKILEQIAQDRADRAQRMSGTSRPQPEPTPASPPSQRVASNSNVARLQFKLPSGESNSHSFPAETTLTQIRQFVDNNITLPFSEYQLATMFPRREFTHRDNSSDLRTLQLLPSAVILILPVSGSQVRVSTGPSWFQVCKDMLWDMIQPLIAVSNYVQSYLFGHPPPTQPEVNSSGRPTSTNSGNRGGVGSMFVTNIPRSAGVRRRGNIHTLSDDGDGNDENNTWNGNSTQQINSFWSYVQWFHILLIASVILKVILDMMKNDAKLPQSENSNKTGFENNRF